MGASSSSVTKATSHVNPSLESTVISCNGAVGESCSPPRFSLKGSNRTAYGRFTCKAHVGGVRFEGDTVPLLPHIPLDPGASR